MKNSYHHSECLSYEQLKQYCEGSLETEIKQEIYTHLSGCALCASAVNGFAAIPFSTKDIQRLNNKLDTKINSTPNHYHLPVAEVLLAGILMLFGFGYFAFVNQKEEIKPQMVTLETHEEKMVRPTMVPTHESIKRDTINQLQSVQNVSAPSQHNIEVASGDSITPEKLPTPAIFNCEAFNVADAEQNITRSSITDEVTFIEDLKVLDFSKIYFCKSNVLTETTDNLPASKENRMMATDDFSKEDAQRMIAWEVLKTSLHYFKKQNYLEANTGFQLLLDKNANDVNALFYSGICCAEQGNFHLAVTRLSAVLTYPNPQFREEANWKLALTYKKFGDNENAKQLFREIVAAKGFYAERAKQQLDK